MSELLVFRAHAAVENVVFLTLRKKLAPFFAGSAPHCAEDAEICGMVAAMHGVLDIAEAHTVLLIKRGRGAMPDREGFFALWRALDRARGTPGERRIAS